MLRKSLYVGGALGLLGLLVFGWDAMSYVGTSVGWVKQSVKDSVPIEFEIERARNAIGELVPAIRQNMHIIAKEEIEVERLAKQIAGGDEKLTSDKADLVRLTDDLKTGQDHFYYASRRYSRDQVKNDLSARFTRFQTQEATLGSLREIHSARTQSLEMAREKLEVMLSAKTQLAADVERLEAQFKTLEVAKSTSEYNFDDSQLGRVKELIADVKRRLDVEERLLGSEGYFQDEIPLRDEKADDNIVDQVTEYFELNGSAVAGAPQAEVVAQ